jgi:tetratricopeptide (TPR) repeat protein
MVKKYKGIFAEASKEMEAKGYLEAFSNINIIEFIDGDGVKLNAEDIDRIIADAEGIVNDKDLTDGYLNRDNDAAAYNNRGNAYYDKGDKDAAIADYSQAVKLDPNYAAAYYNRGIAYSAKGDKDAAIADYSQAVKLDPNDAAAYYSRGNANYDMRTTTTKLSSSIPIMPRPERVLRIYREGQRI